MIYNPILLIDKPKGITSFDVIRILQKNSREKGKSKIKIGHAGTLDPNASGLMILGMGEGTKKLNQYLKLSKSYVAEVLLGVETDTGDVDGAIVKRDSSIGDFDLDSLREKLGVISGEMMLPVPKYSAIKRGGEALYKKARRGEDFETPIKPMRVYKTKIQDLTFVSSTVFKHETIEGRFPIIKISFDVGSGTYIRSLVQEIGRILNISATLKELRRTKVGDFDIKDAKSLEDFKS